MPISAMTFQPETFQQANPFLTGVSAAQGIYAQGVQNQFMGPMMRQQLLNSQLSNQILGAQAPYAGQQAQANLAVTQAQPAYLKAQTAYTGANANLLGQETPYLVEQQKLGMFTDPILRRLAQAQLAQSGAISPDLLAQAGIGASPQQGGMNPGMPQPGMAQGMSPQMQGGVPQMPGQMPPQGMPGQQQSGNPNLGGPPPPQTLPAAPGNIPMTPAQQQRYQQLAQMGALNQMGGQGQPQQVANIPGANSLTTAPNAFGGNPQQNWALFGTPYNPLQYSAAKTGMDTQAKTNVDQWNSLQQEASQAANDAKISQNSLTQFKNAYDNTLEKGPGLGHLPAVTGNSQLVDSAAANLQLDLAKMQKFQRLTNYDLQIVGKAKPNRSMTPSAINELTGFLQAKNQQIKEQQDFNLAARSQGVDPNTARTLWNNYQDQRPVYDFDTKQPFTHLQGTWRDFLTPQAVQSAQAGYPYVPIPDLKGKTQLLAWKKTLSDPNKAIVGAQLQNQGTQ